MSTAELYSKIKIELFEDEHLVEADAQLVCEEELVVFVNETYISTLVYSPASSTELALGFLLSEAVLNQDSDVTSIDCSEKGKITVITSRPLPETQNHPSADDFPSKSRRILETILPRSLSELSEPRFKASHLLDLISELDNRALTFRITGGVHSAALADTSGMLARYEDIGRHNAVDKVFGHAFLNKISVSDKCLIVSGRISNEILSKAAVNKIPLVLSRSAPTLQAVKWADKLGITLVGFARGSRFNAYTHPQRIQI